MVNKKMRRKLLLVSVVVCGGYFVNVSAQGYLTDTRTSNAIQMRDPARQASVEVDAAVVNPAGTAFMNDGLHLSASGFASFQTIEAQNKDNQFVQETKATQWLPAVQLVYKKNRWAVSASFANEGGFGRREVTGPANPFWVTDQKDFDELAAVFKDLSNLYLVAGLLPGSNLGLDIKQEDMLNVSLDNVETKMYNKAIRLGFSYKLTEKLSAYVGAKANYVSAKGSSFFNMGVLRPSTGEIKTIYDYYSLDKMDIANMDIDEETKRSLLDKVDKTRIISDDINYSAHGWGFAPVIGLDYKTGKLNFGAKYEFASHINATGGADFNIPALLSLGGSWRCSDKLKLAVGGDIVFSDDKAWYGKRIDAPTSWDVSASATYDINDKVSVSGGYTLGSANFVAPEYIPVVLEASEPLTHKLSFGAAWNILKNMQVNAGMAVGMPVHRINVSWAGDYEGKSSYRYKLMTQFALGVNYSF